MKGGGVMYDSEYLIKKYLNSYKYKNNCFYTIVFLFFSRILSVKQNLAKRSIFLLFIMKQYIFGTSVDNIMFLFNVKRNSSMSKCERDLEP